MRTCTFPSCHRAYHSRGFCRAHADQVKRGEPTRPIRRYLRPGASLDEIFSAFTVKSGDCVEWSGEKTRKGYGRVRVDGGPRRLAHRVAWERANGTNVPAGACVMHTCDNPSCVFPGHLLIGSVTDNNRDMRAKLRHARRERNGQAKLSMASATEIRALYAAGVSQHDLAKRYGVAQTTISPLVRGLTWRTDDAMQAADVARGGR